MEICVEHVDDHVARLVVSGQVLCDDSRDDATRIASQLVVEFAPRSIVVLDVGDARATTPEERAVLSGAIAGLITFTSRLHAKTLLVVVIHDDPTDYGRASEVFRDRRGLQYARVAALARAHELAAPVAAELVGEQ